MIDEATVTYPETEERGLSIVGGGEGALALLEPSGESALTLLEPLKENESAAEPSGVEVIGEIVHGEHIDITSEYFFSFVENMNCKIQQALTFAKSNCLDEFSVTAKLNFETGRTGFVVSHECGFKFDVSDKRKGEAFELPVVYDGNNNPVIASRPAQQMSMFD